MRYRVSCLVLCTKHCLETTGGSAVQNEVSKHGIKQCTSPFFWSSICEPSAFEKGLDCTFLNDSYLLLLVCWSAPFVPWTYLVPYASLFMFNREDRSLVLIISHQYILFSRTVKHNWAPCLLPRIQKCRKDRLWNIMETFLVSTTSKRRHPEGLVFLH